MTKTTFIKFLWFTFEWIIFIAIYLIVNVYFGNTKSLSDPSVLDITNFGILIVWITRSLNKEQS